MIEEAFVSLIKIRLFDVINKCPNLRIATEKEILFSVSKLVYLEIWIEMMGNVDFTGAFA